MGGRDVELFKVSELLFDLICMVDLVIVLIVCLMIFDVDIVLLIDCVGVWLLIYGVLMIEVMM